MGETRRPNHLIIFLQLVVAHPQVFQPLPLDPHPVQPVLTIEELDDVSK